MYIYQLLLLIIILTTLSNGDDFSEFKPKWKIGQKWKVAFFTESQCPQPADKSFKCPPSYVYRSNCLFWVETEMKIAKEKYIAICIQGLDSLGIPYDTNNYSRMYFNENNYSLSFVEDYNKATKEIVRKVKYNLNDDKDLLGISIIIPNFNNKFDTILGDTLFPTHDTIGQYNKLVICNNNRKNKLAFVSICRGIYITGYGIKRINQTWIAGIPWWINQTVTIENKWKNTSRLYEFNNKYIDTVYCTDKYR